MSSNLKSAFVKITVHYIVLVSACWVVFTSYPDLIEYFPIGTTERIFSSARNYELESTVHAGRLEEASQTAHAIFFFVCFLSSILLTIPVGATYLGARSAKKTDASIAKAIIILPIAVTGLVLIVQNSLALAFSLAGIVAGTGIRFRANMKEFTDTLFFLITIGIGLSAGVGSIGLAAIMSIVFCYTILIVHAIGYGEVEKPKKLREADQEVINPVIEQ